MSNEPQTDRDAGFFLSTHHNCGGENVTRGNQFPYLRCHRCGADYYQDIEDAREITREDAMAKLGQ